MIYRTKELLLLLNAQACFPTPLVTVLLKETEHSVGFVERSGKVEKCDKYLRTVHHNKFFSFLFSSFLFSSCLQIDTTGTYYKN